ncbi:hypothetical protein EDB83DRAFT_1837433 [Lactarius deliciosus]|nr:hypothetical protein EDB83DRAFT_1837433 [Lactarius deliciosus]
MRSWEAHKYVSGELSAMIDYFCLEPDLLTQISRDTCAYDGRLTSKCPSCSRADLFIGWGGFTVSLVVEDKVGRFIEKLRKAYKIFKVLDSEAANGGLRNEAELWFLWWVATPHVSLLYLLSPDRWILSSICGG